MNKLPSVKMVTIDVWPTYVLDSPIKDSHNGMWHDLQCGPDELRLIQSYERQDPHRIEGEDLHKLWKTWTACVPNLTGIRALTSMPNAEFNGIDFLFHDAAHDYETVYADLVHWWPLMKGTGRLLMDDYSTKDFPGVVWAVDQFVAENNLKLEMLATNRNVLLTY